MKKILLSLVAMLCVMATFADTFNYKFRSSTRLSEAITRLAEQHPDLHINFIYNELDNYKTTAIINTDNAYEALRQIVGLNPVSVLKKGGRYYIEALQHGKFVYSGRIVGTDEEPVVGATLTMLAPQDSTVITYGFSDNEGNFSIPCDVANVIAKFKCLGYKEVYRKLDNFRVGTHSTGHI
ncbi:MAG: carboxypeptidase-like regulatory domain-containing protein [Muribaculaceae bacterium]|nr:carboxypeptidase-like regulatory domain-containing protein [Muribaculaceae bacterium]